jgi:hypothetical protein
VALKILSRVVWRVGLQSHYRAEFWNFLKARAREWDLESILHIGVVAHHLITYAQACTQGKMQSSNYSSRAVEQQALATTPAT